MNRSNKCVASDSSFYIAFLSPREIYDLKTFLEILQKYKFFIGEVVFKEISKRHEEILEKINFKNQIEFIDKYDYSALLSIIGDKIFKKGEYESIAIAFFLHKKLKLHSLILDDNPARNWVKRNIPELTKFVKYSLRFLVNCCCNDGTLSSKKVISILNRVKEVIKNGKKPFNLTEKNIHIVVDQLLYEVEKCQN